MGLLDRLRRSSAMTPSDAAAALDAGQLVLVDVREAGEYRAGHAPGSLHVPLDQVGSSLDRVGASGKEIAFVCRSGARSAMATGLAVRAGLPARNVKGGMLAWQRAGLPVEAGKARNGRR
ncbi:MAG TPA: rhodanese-like domain-containing protein [Baekduia sp.]|nr:rhodanese-like domain-containing protein [Baekduia sp.]